MRSSFSDTAEKLIAELEKMNRQAMKTVLTFGEMSMSEGQYRAFRKVVFDIYGVKGLQRRVREVVSRSFGIRTVRAGAPDGKGQDYGRGAVSMR